jgi:hypothetical protein
LASADAPSILPEFGRLEMLALEVVDADADDDDDPPGSC